MKNKRWIIDLSLILIIIVIGLFIALEIDQRAKALNESAEPNGSGDSIELEQFDSSPTDEDTIIQDPVPAKEFVLVNLAGETVALSNHLGQPVMVNFWATWCPPCRKEMPIIQKYADLFDDRLVVLAINAGEEESVVQNFVIDSGLDLQFLLDPTNSVAELYAVRGFPTTLFINTEGSLVATHIGELDELLITYYLEMIGLSE